MLSKLYKKIEKEDKILITTNKEIEYYNIPAAFDIETTSFYDGDELPENKRALMYIWQFGIGNLVTTGRTWEQFLDFLSILRKILGLNNERRLVIYVHNLPYEFQFIRKRLNWEEVFNIEKRKPVYCTSQGIEFKCSLKLSGGKSLEKVGEDLQKYKVQKAVGFLDYKVIRTPLTPLSEKELKYCEDDIRVLLSYIQEKIEQDGDITRIPLTNTGYVRNYCRKACYKRWKPYRELMNELTIDVDEYHQLKRAFQGGFTHANSNYLQNIMDNVGSHDFSSSYPAVLVLNKFPMSQCIKMEHQLSSDEFKHLLLSKCCLFDIEIWGLKAKITWEHALSKYKCHGIPKDYRIKGTAKVDNGRLVECDYLWTTLTEQDYFILTRFYSWDKIRVTNFRYYEKRYLPKPLVLAILKLYGDKTTLKGVEGRELNYMISKNMTNATYGMMATDPVRETYIYSDNNEDPFPKQDLDIEKVLSKYNNNIRRFIFYPWGVWTTAYARANLFSGILALGEDYLYSDTDSVKSLNTEKHLDYFQQYNDRIKEKIRLAAEWHHISEDLFSPKTIKGKEETIGLWDDEGVYEKFKTLGAKRYLTFRRKKREFEEKDGTLVQLTEPDFVLTLAGSNKKKTMGFLRSTGSPFETFDNELTIPPSRSGRLILTYIDKETEGDIVDCNGVPYHYHELSSIHMEPSEYNLSMSEEFLDFITEVQDFGE